MPIKNHLYVHDGQHLSVGEACPVFGEFRVENYLTGRCHLMALALSEGAGLTCAVLLDVEAGYDADDEPVAALEHAFVELGRGPKALSLMHVAGGSVLTSWLNTTRHFPQNLSSGRKLKT